MPSAVCAVIGALVSGVALAHYGVGPYAQLWLLASLAATVVAPGWAVSRRFARIVEASPFTSVALATTAGFGVQIVAWAAAVSTGWHALLWVLPVAVVLWGGLRWRSTREARRQATPTMSDGVRPSTPVARTPWWLRVSVLAGWLLLLRSAAVGIWQANPAGTKLGWYPDLSWHVSLTAEAMRRVPLRDPQSAADGVLSYHWFVNASEAAWSMTSGVDLEHVAIVAWAVPILLATLGLATGMARRLSGGATAPAMAAILVTFPPSLVVVNDLDAQARSAMVWLSPSHMLAVPVGLLAFWVVLEALTAPRVTWQWVLGCAAAGVLCTGTKVSLLPVLFGGLVLVALTQAWRRDRATARRALWFALGACAVLIVTSPLFAGGGGGSKPDFGGIAGQLAVWKDDPTRGWLDPTTMTLLVVVLALGSMPMLTVAALPKDTAHRPVSVAAPMFVGALGVALVTMLFLQHPSHSQIYFMRGIAAPSVVFFACAIVALARRHRRAVPLALALGVVVGCAWSASSMFSATHIPRPRWLLPVALVLVAVSAVIVGGLRRTHGRYALVAAVLAAVVGGISCAPAVVTWTRSETPSTHAYPSPTAEEVAAAGVLARANPHGRLVATNVHCLRVVTTPHCDARGFWVSALTHSPVLVGGWGYSSSARVHHGDGGFSYLRQPYRPEDVARLNDRFMTAPTADAKSALMRAGVRFVYADRRASMVSPRLASMGRVVHSSRQVVIVDLGGR